VKNNKFKGVYFMAELIFDRAQKMLSWPARKLTWRAVSGPFGAGQLPAGIYDIARREITEYTNKVDIPYRDKTGMGFFVPIYPKFQTNRGKTGGRLGIHPDGNKPGTLGCIGITEANTRSFHDAIKQTAPSVLLTLQVK
jgi:hypothetical protein